MARRTELLKAARRRPRLTALACVLVLVLTTGAWWGWLNDRTVTAYFTSAAGVFADNEVQILGVPVGQITSVEPQGTVVKIEMKIDRKVKLPADVRAVAVSPSLVTGRLVQLTPPYRGGAELAEGAEIAKERTAAPIGVDELYRAVNELSRSLGPDGANQQGALSDALDVGAQNLDGNGEALNSTVRNLGQLSGTLANSREDLFATVKQLQSFTSMLAAKDDEVREFNGRLADVSRLLAGQRDDLGAALRELSLALGEVSDFVQDNREALRSNVDRLTQVTRVLVNQRAALGEILNTAPAALNNLDNTYNASSGTLDTRANLNELSMPPVLLLCELLRRGAPGGLPQAVTDLCDQLEPLANLPLPSPPEIISSLQSGQLPPVPGLAVPTTRGER